MANKDKLVGMVTVVSRTAFFYTKGQKTPI